MECRIGVWGNKASLTNISMRMSGLWDEFITLAETLTDTLKYFCHCERPAHTSKGHSKYIVTSWLWGQSTKVLFVHRGRWLWEVIEVDSRDKLTHVGRGAVRSLKTRTRLGHNILGLHVLIVCNHWSSLHYSRTM